MGLRKTPPPQAELEYTPRPQFIPFHQRSQRWSCLVAHRRAGKTVACVFELLIRALYTKKQNARFGYVAPFRQQAKAIAWLYLKDAARDFAVEIRESDLSIELPNNAKIALYGSDNPDALRGLYFDGLVVDEFADCRPNLWAEVLLPTLADRKGWATVIGTPKGKLNQFYDFNELSKQSEDWFHLTLKAETSNILDPEELSQLKAQMSDGQYQQELQCSFTATLLGTYYSTLINQIELNGQIGPHVEYDPNFPVTVSLDIGYTDSTVIWFFQERPDGIAYIDVHEGHGQPLSHYFDTLRSKPYQYDTIWLPHDAKAKTLQTGKSTADQFIEQYRSTNTKLDIVPNLSVQDGIEAVRMTLPYCHFSPKCQLGIEALRTYRRKYNDLLQRFEDKPLHDFCSDWADSFRYSVLVADKVRLKPPEPHPLLTEQFHSYNLEQLYAERTTTNRTYTRRRI